MGRWLRAHSRALLMAGLLAVAGLAGIVISNAQTVDRTPILPAPGNIGADINGDGKVDLTDMSRMFSAWNKANTSEDIKGNGRVEIGDLSVLFTNWRP